MIEENIPAVLTKPDLECADFNEDTLKNLIRELSFGKDAKTVEEEVRVKVRQENRSRDLDQKINVNEAVAKARESAPTQNWTPLQRIALRRAAVALIDFDGIERGVSKNEAEGISSRYEHLIMSTVRQLVLRYDQERSGFDPLVATIASEELGQGIFPIIHE